MTSTPQPLTDIERKAAEQILRDHTECDFCCYADRGPCYWDGIERKFSCSARTCSKCARSPYDAKEPTWPCGPVLLARRALGLTEDQSPEPLDETPGADTPTLCDHDPRYSRSECGACGLQVAWCDKCGVDLCGCNPLVNDPATTPDLPATIDRADLIGQVASAMSSPRLPPEAAIHPWGETATRVVDEVVLPLLGRVDRPPRIGDRVGVVGTVRTVETIYPPGHYRITLDTIIPNTPSMNAAEAVELFLTTLETTHPSPAVQAVIDQIRAENNTPDPHQTVEQ